MREELTRNDILNEISTLQTLKFKFQDDSKTLAEITDSLNYYISLLHEYDRRNTRRSE